jgi:hypothetical protein
MTETKSNLYGLQGPDVQRPVVAARHHQRRVEPVPAEHVHLKSHFYASKNAKKKVKIKSILFKNEKYLKIREIHFPK